MNNPYSPPNAKLEEIGAADSSVGAQKRIPLVRTVVAAVAAEAGTYVVWLVVLALSAVILNGPDERRMFAYLAGQPVGIGAGFLLCVFAGHRVAVRSSRTIGAGFAVGITCAALNAALIASATSFPPILLLGTLSRVVGGGLGGWLARRRRQQPNNALQRTLEDSRS